MPERALSLGDALRRLHKDGVLAEAEVSRAAAHLRHRGAETDTGTPWYVRLFIAFGAWLAAGMFLLFLGIAGLFPRDDFALMGMGLVFIAVAVALRRQAEHVFWVQLALAVSMNGHGMTLWGAWEAGDSLWLAALLATALCAALYLLYPDALHRFLSCLLVFVLLVAWSLGADSQHGIHPVFAVEIAGIWLFTRSPLARELMPLAYASAVALPLTLLLVVDQQVRTVWWPSSVTMTLALVWLCSWIPRGGAGLRREGMVLGILAAILLGAIAAPGVLAALGLLVLGYARRDRQLLGLGLVFLPAFIICYYYDLNVSLLAKSGILTASGAVLLLARWYLGLRIGPAADAPGRGGGS